MIVAPPRLTLSTTLLVLGTIAILASGQVLFKMASTGLQLSQPRTFFTWQLIVALAAYAVATLLWLLVLTRLPLSVAFPFYGLTFLLVPALAWLFLGEPVRLQTFVGGAIILVGVVVCARASA
jgi:drug/metabolite transporter (DMT)-like permease